MSLAHETDEKARMKLPQKRDGKGRLRKSIPDNLVRRIFADYKRLGSLDKTGTLYDRAGATIWALLHRRGLIKSGRPTERFIRRMYRDYKAGLSLEEVGDKYKRTRQTIFDTFKRRGFKLRKKTFLAGVVYKGQKYTSQTIRGRHRYLRCTRARTAAYKKHTAYLHHVIWQEYRGAIPPGHKVCFKDGNHLNCAFENLELLTNSAQVRKYAAKGANQFTVSATERLNVLVGNFESGKHGLAKDLKARAA